MIKKIRREILRVIEGDEGASKGARDSYRSTQGQFAPAEIGPEPEVGIWFGL